MSESDEYVKQLHKIIHELRMDYEKKAEPWLQKLVDHHSLRAPQPIVLHHSIIQQQEPSVPMRVMFGAETVSFIDEPSVSIAIAISIAAERERCAKIAEEMDYWPDKPIAKRIRGVK